MALQAVSASAPASVAANACGADGARARAATRTTVGAPFFTACPTRATSSRRASSLFTLKLANADGTANPQRGEIDVLVHSRRRYNDNPKDDSSL